MDEPQTQPVSTLTSLAHVAQIFFFLVIKESMKQNGEQHPVPLSANHSVTWEFK
jgi:hypothetical protein